MKETTVALALWDRCLKGHFFRRYKNISTFIHCI